MRNVTPLKPLLITLIFLHFLFWPSSGKGDQVAGQTQVLDLSREWGVLQDVHDLGEELGIYREDWNPQTIGPAFSEWEPIERLTHLQLLYAQTPYFGRQLRYFNEHAWWYKLEFETPKDTKELATLRFEGVDYFAKVWLNEELLGEHEGYFNPFEFEVGDLLRSDRPNLLIVKVWSPWDHEVRDGRESARFWAVIRNLVKGTYEHADTFVQRDVNPVGIWRDVKLVFHTGMRWDGKPAVNTDLARDYESAAVKVTAPVFVTEGEPEVTLRCRIQDETTGFEVASAEQTTKLQAGRNHLEANTTIEDPSLWQTWDRGQPSLYKASLELVSGGSVLQQTEERFGIREIELRRTEQETTYYLNGEKLYIRGTNYFPDVYVSNMHRERYARDLANIRRAGVNAVRVHVHVEQPDFYEICDELGLAVMQDSDLNWTHPTTEAFKDRAVKVFGDMIRQLRNHPSIITWVCLNEPPAGMQGKMLTETPGPQLYAEAQRLDPNRPAIRGSGIPTDLESGDSHNYTGSLERETKHYTEIHGTTEKLNTEFGFDAPPVVANLQRVPMIYERLKAIVDKVPSIQNYQYRLLKYYIEHYRMQKYQPCSGYFQFMFIDLCPQSFYGVYDWWGVPKQGLRALEESNQPLGVFMEHVDEPVALWVVNDLRKAYPGSEVEWIVSDEDGGIVARGKKVIDLSEDSLVKVSNLSFPVDRAKRYTVSLLLRDAKRELLSQNVYHEPFHHPPRPEGHPSRMTHELGMRLYSAP